MLFQKETLSSSVESIVSQYIVNGVLSNSYLLVFLDKINATLITELLSFLIILDKMVFNT